MVSCTGINEHVTCERMATMAGVDGLGVSTYDLCCITRLYASIPVPVVAQMQRGLFITRESRIDGDVPMLLSRRISWADSYIRVIRAVCAIVSMMTLPQSSPQSRVVVAPLFCKVPGRFRSAGRSKPGGNVHGARACEVIDWTRRCICIFWALVWCCLEPNTIRYRQSEVWPERARKGPPGAWKVRKCKAVCQDVSRDAKISNFSPPHMDFSLTPIFDRRLLCHIFNQETLQTNTFQVQTTSRCRSEGKLLLRVRTRLRLCA